MTFFLFIQTAQKLLVKQYFQSLNKILKKIGLTKILQISTCHHFSLLVRFMPQHNIQMIVTQYALCSYAVCAPAMRSFAVVCKTACTFFKKLNNTNKGIFQDNQDHGGNRL